MTSYILQVTRYKLPATKLSSRIDQLLTRHAYSNDGDAVPKDDTTCVVIRIEHESDPVSIATCCLAG